MSFQFTDLLDTPDYTVGAGMWLIMTYSYRWDDLLRTKTLRRHITTPIHLRDIVKAKQDILVKAWARTDLKGPFPRLFNMNVCVAELAQY